MASRVVNVTPDSRRIGLSQYDLADIKEIYESVMNLAANGLFFRWGQVVGRGIAKRAAERSGSYLFSAAAILVEDGWAKSAELDREQARIIDCIEARPNMDRSCNIMRGILAEVYTHHYETKLFCHEVECAGGGAPRCVFQIRKGVL
jgi:predicted hydrocarbon binding protein